MLQVVTKYSPSPSSLVSRVLLDTDLNQCERFRGRVRGLIRKKQHGDGGGQR